MFDDWGWRSIVKDNNAVTSHGHGAGDDLAGPKTADLEAMPDPVKGDISEDINEADQRHDIGDAGIRGICDSALDGWEHCAATDAHDEDAGATTRVTAQVGCAEGENGRVHWSFEEEDTNEHADGSGTAAGTHVCSHGNGDTGVAYHDEFGSQNGRNRRRDETSNGEGNEGIRQHVRRFGGCEAGFVRGIVDEERCDGDLGADVAELSYTWMRKQNVDKVDYRRGGGTYR